MAKVKDARPHDVEIVLSDGTPRRLRYTLSGLADLEDKYGSVDEAFKKAEQGNIKATIAVVWAGLTWDDPKLTEREVGNLIDIRDLETLSNTIADAMTNSIADSGKPAPN